MLPGVKKLGTRYDYEISEEDFMKLLGLEGNRIERLDHLGGNVKLSTTDDPNRSSRKSFDDYAQELGMVLGKPKEETPVVQTDWP